MKIQNKYVKIIDDGLVYPAFQLNDTHTKNKEIQSKAIEKEWDKTGFYPKNGMIGEIVETYKSFWKGTTTIHYILKIKLTYYVNIDKKGVEFVEKSIWESSVKEPALDELRSYKEKLDLELISQEEYDKKKEELRRFIL